MTARTTACDTGNAAKDLSACARTVATPEMVQCTSAEMVAVITKSLCLECHKQLPLTMFSRSRGRLGSRCHDCRAQHGTPAELLQEGDLVHVVGHENECVDAVVLTRLTEALHVETHSEHGTGRATAHSHQWHIAGAACPNW